MNEKQKLLEFRQHDTKELRLNGNRSIYGQEP